ncbi:ATP-binding cassette domain-containing protein [bacterium]|nr:MAG: ATP-binding cassette domain-containing protein [bacterium]
MRGYRHPMVILGAAFVLLPLLFHVLGSPLSLATQIVIYVLYGIAFNVLLGFTGMTSFGSSVFFGVSGYVVALTALHLTQGLALGLLLATVAAALLGVMLGFLILRRRGLYFALLTLAFTQLFYEIAFHWTPLTGGENGLQGVSRGIVASDGAFYVFSAIIVYLATFALFRIVHSPFGRVLQAIRDNEQRVQCLGYNPFWYKMGAFIISATFIGLAGGLLTYLIRGVYADNLNWQHAGDPVMMTLLGGMNYFLGPLWGAIIYIWLSDQLSAYTEHWYLIFGAILVLVVLFSPEGLSGIWARLRRAEVRWRLTTESVPPPPAGSGDVTTFHRAWAGAGPILSVHGLEKRFGNLIVADRIDLKVQPGKIHSIIGPNGAGKTTLFNMLSGLLDQDGGSVIFKGEDVSAQPAYERAMKGMSRSFQVVSVGKNLTVFETLRIAVQSRSPHRASLLRDAYTLRDVVERTWTLLRTVGLDAKAAEVVGNLPHGEKRLLDIAMALACQPELLLLDEPLAGLTDADRERISALIRHLAGSHTILLIEHDIDRVISLSDRITVLHQGRVIAEGAPAEIVNHPDVVSAYLGHEYEKSPAQPAALVRSLESAGKVLLALDGIDAGYGGSRVLNQVNLVVKEGEAVALLGRNGVGKTTTVYTIMGIVKASAGTLRFEDSDVTHWSPDRINRLGISVVPQGRRVFPNLTVVDNLKLAQRPGGWALEEAFDVFPRLAERMGALGQNLSGGEQQMLAIARALMAPTRLILLDEPFEGLAPAVVAEVKAAVERLRARASILIVEQRVDLALEIADRAYIMVNGSIACESAAGALQQDRELQVRLLGV